MKTNTPSSGVPQNGLPIRADDIQLKGVYANIMSVAHTREEFVLDFASVVAGQGILVSRVIVSPGHMKRIAEVAAENVRAYEKNFGKIEGGKGIEEEFGFRAK